MTVKKKQIVECDVIDVAFGGKGLAKIDGFAVFVDQTVTGDRVAARIVKKKTQLRRGGGRRDADAIAQARENRHAPTAGSAAGANGSLSTTPTSLSSNAAMWSTRWSISPCSTGPPCTRRCRRTRFSATAIKMEFSCSDRRWVDAP